jgi:hypothetical protein
MNATSGRLAVSRCLPSRHLLGEPKQFVGDAQACGAGSLPGSLASRDRSAPSTCPSANREKQRSGNEPAHEVEVRRGYPSGGCSPAQPASVAPGPVHLPQVRPASKSERLAGQAVRVSR